MDKKLLLVNKSVLLEANKRCSVLIKGGSVGIIRCGVQIKGV